MGEGKSEILILGLFAAGGYEVIAGKKSPLAECKVAE